MADCIEKRLATANRLLNATASEAAAEITRLRDKLAEATKLIDALAPLHRRPPVCVADACRHCRAVCGCAGDCWECGVMQTITVTRAGTASPSPRLARMAQEVESKAVSLVPPMVLAKIKQNPVPKRGK